jgi:hypothetical protein
MLEYLITDNGLLPPVQTAVPYGAPAHRPTTREEIFAVANTARLLQKLGDRIEVTEEDEMQARDLFANGREPNAYERQLPAVMLKLNALLDEYDYSLLEDAHRIRHYVANRLLEETEDPDPRIRLRAYEMLGKITEVGLFTERSEVTIHHKPTEELEAILRDKLERLMPKVIEHDAL